MRLWDYYDGEPFLENPRARKRKNPPLLVINPKKHAGKRTRRKLTRLKKRKAANPMAKRRQPAALRKYWATHRRKRANPARRKRRTYRRNAWPVGGLVVNSRRRRRGRRMASNPRRHHRRRMRRNPGLGGIIAMPKMSHVLYTAGGFIAPPFVEGLIARAVPVDLQTSTIGKYAIRIGAVLGLTWAVKNFIGRAEAFYVGLGGWSYVGITAVREFMPTLIPGASAMGLSGYARPAQLAAYAPPAPSALRGYNPPAFPAVVGSRAMSRWSRGQ